ncbi:hypothetical protein [Streptomyces sp. NPDC052535]|uniref:hypothetical protein n=1 Tax=Streptomyces sp. NPDC052535 TaxID=3155531 RepID=UPI00343E6EDB
MSVMTENKTETFEGVETSKVHVGDRLQFITRETGFNGRGLYTRTGTVVKVTAKTVHVDCRDSYEGIAVLRKHQPSWHERDVRRLVTEEPARRPYNAENVQYVDQGNIVTAVWCSDPTVSPETALENDLRSLTGDVPYEVEVIAEATRYYRTEGANFSGWIISQGSNYSTEPIKRKPNALEELRGWVESYFTR